MSNNMTDAKLIAEAREMGEAGRTLAPELARLLLLLADRLEQLAKINERYAAALARLAHDALAASKEVTNELTN